MLVGVSVLNVPFTTPAASAKTAAGVSPLHVLLRPALLAVAPVMWASHGGTVPRTHAESGPIALGSLCSVATGGRGSHSAKLR
jgi:hypothetical protein